MFDETALRSALTAWSVQPLFAIAPITGGVNSRTWRVECPSGRFVAKLVADDLTFDAGLFVAEYLESVGFSAGGPIDRALARYRCRVAMNG